MAGSGTCGTVAPHVARTLQHGVSPLVPLTTGIGTDAFYKLSPTRCTPESKSHLHIPPLSPPDTMLRFDFQPAKQVECSDQQLKRAQALFDEHGAVMDPHDRVLAQSLLEKDFEAKYFLLEASKLDCTALKWKKRCRRFRRS